MNEGFEERVERYLGVIAGASLVTASISVKSVPKQNTETEKALAEANDVIVSLAGELQALMDTKA